VKYSLLVLLLLAAPASAWPWTRSPADRAVFAESVAIAQRVEFQNQLPMYQVDAIVDCQRRLANRQILAEYERYRTSVEQPSGGEAGRPAAVPGSSSRP
jgi:hypothetical protein